MIQGSDEWKQGRCGFVTASRFADVLAKGQGTTRGRYLRQVLAERLSGKPYVGYQNSDMERGIAQEPFAREAFEVETGEIVEQVGFLIHPRLDHVGCSPDGLTSDAGIEIKSVLPHVQVETILRESMPPEHKPQVFGSMMIAQRPRWHFASYCPDMPAHLQLVIYTIEWDDAYIDTLRNEIVRFDAEVTQLYERLMNTRPLLDQLVASIDARGVATQP